MKKALLPIQILFALYGIVAMVLVLLFETDTIPIGYCAGMGTQVEYTLLLIMEIVLLAGVPTALRWMKFSSVKRQITSEQSIDRYLFHSSCRLCVLGIPLITNTLFYYLFMNVTFVYMALMFAVCFAFVLPTKSRYTQETHQPSKP